MNLGTKYDGFLLDMNGTFMFGQDRFGPTQTYSGTYQALGGALLDASKVQDIVSRAVDFLLDRYVNPDFEDNFPSVLNAFQDDPATEALPLTEVQLLMRVVAEHECGSVPQAYADWLRATSRTHWLGLITNICSPKDRWLDQFERDGLDRVFSACVWSSDGRSIKPSAVMFEEILAAWPGDRDRIAMVGDSPRCDIAGAQRVGHPTILVGGADDPSIKPTHRYQSILEIPLTNEGYDLNEIGPAD